MPYKNNKTVLAGNDCDDNITVKGSQSLLIHNCTELKRRKTILGKNRII